MSMKDGVYYQCISCRSFGSYQKIKTCPMCNVDMVEVNVKNPTGTIVNANTREEFELPSLSLVPQRWISSEELRRLTKEEIQEKLTSNLTKCMRKNNEL